MRNSVAVLQVCIILLAIGVFNHVIGWQQKGSGRKAQGRGRAIEKGEGQSPDNKVSGGTEPPKHDYHFVVTIEKWERKWIPVGLGTIYNPWTVFTTAKLYNDIKGLIDNRNVRIGAGSHNLKLFENTRQYRQPCSGGAHPNYNGQINNLGILHLSEAFRFNKYVSNIQIPKTDASVSGSCRFGGWGDTSNGGTSFGTISQKFPTMATGCSPSDKSIICTSSATCKGDEGAPLVCTQNNRMFAYGIAIDVTGACGSGNSNFFATTQLDRAWLNTTIDAGRTKCRTYYKY